MKFKILAAVFALPLTLIISGCAIRFDPAQGATSIAQSDQVSLEKTFPLGSTASKNVLLKLGPPSLKSKEAGYEIWQYKYVKSTSVSVLFVSTPIEARKTALFYFNEGTGILEKIDFKEEQS